VLVSPSLVADLSGIMRKIKGTSRANTNKNPTTFYQSREEWGLSHNPDSIDVINRIGYG